MVTNHLCLGRQPISPTEMHLPDIAPSCPITVFAHRVSSLTFWPMAAQRVIPLAVSASCWRAWTKYSTSCVREKVMAMNPVMGAPDERQVTRLLK